MSTHYDPEQTVLAPRAEGSTSAYAWVCSPLGDPTDSAAERPYETDFPTHRVAAPTKKRRPIDKTFVAGGLIGLIGAGVVLGIALFGSSPAPQHVDPASEPTSVPAPAPAAVVAPLPDSQPAAAPVVNADAPAPQASAPVRPQLSPPHSLPSPPKPPAPRLLKLPAPPALPPLCLPPHHLVQGVCK